MKNGYIAEILSSYGISAVVIAVIVSVICVVIEKTFAKKLKNGIKGYVPFIAGIVITFIYNLIVLDLDLAISEETLCSGLCSGSLGVIIKTAVKKIICGKSIPKSKTSLLIEGIICDYVVTNLSVAVGKIESIVINESEQNLSQSIKGVLLEHTNDNVSEDEIHNLVSILIESLNTLNS